MSGNASGKQFNFIQRLLEERRSHVPEGDVDAFMVVIQGKRITGKGASILIDKLLAIPADPIAPPAGAPVVTNRDPSRRSNAYPGKCIKCGHEVGKGAGYLTGSRATGWGCEHLDGECKTGEVEPRKHELTEIVGDLEDGNYAIPSSSGDTDVTYITIATNKGFYNPDKAGQRIVRIVAGGGNEFVVSNEWVRKAVATIHALGTTESMQLFARELHVCGRCGEDLTQVTSKVTGFGPTCRNKIGYVVSAEEKAEVKRLIAEALAQGEVLSA